MSTSYDRGPNVCPPVMMRGPNACPPVMIRGPNSCPPVMIGDLMYVHQL